MNHRSNNRRRKSHNNHLDVEALESRQLLSATLSGRGTWNISGTNASDEIYVARDEADPSVLLAEVNGRIVGEEYAADVAKIQISGRSGNDHIEIDESAGAISVPTVLRGHAGDDVIVGGSGRDVIIGGRGHDELIGNGGNDRIYGGSGDDYLEGGVGADRLSGGSGVNELVQDSTSDNDDGDEQQDVTVRVPAEWERHDSTWMQWPKGIEASYRENFAGIIRTLQAYEQVNLVVQSQSARSQASQFLQQRGVPLENVQFHILPYDWSWMRDNGAIWVEKTDADGNRQHVVQDWGFDGWGGDGGPSRRDDAVPCHVASIEGVACEKVSVVLEKGTLEFNGKDTVITSWTVLNNRNPGMTRGQLETVLKDRFGVSKVVWLEGASQGDITEGHVDGIARFVNENTVVVGRYTDQSDPDAALFERAAATIRAAGFNVVRMDIPGYVRYRGEWLPANYTNYLVANGVVIASSYANTQFDNNARQQLQQLFPNHDIVLTDTRELWYNGGAVHCVTNDQPLLVRGSGIAAGNSGATGTASVSVDPAPQADRLQQLAERVDAQHGLFTTGRTHENWGGRGEKWMKGNEGWYFVTPDGSLYLWNRGRGAQGTLIARFDARFHADPSTIYDAPRHALRMSSGTHALDSVFADTSLLS